MLLELKYETLANRFEILLNRKIAEALFRRLSAFRCKFFLPSL